MDYGDNPSFKITRMTGMATWRTGTGNFILYGTNDISNVGGNDGGRRRFIKHNRFNSNI